MKESEDNPTWVTLAGVIIFAIVAINYCNGYKSPQRKAAERIEQEVRQKTHDLEKTLNSDEFRKKMEELQKNEPCNNN